MTNGEQAIFQSIEGLRGELMDFAETQTKHDVYITGIKKILYDNGQPGLLSKFTKTQNKVDNHIEKHQEHKTDRQWLVPVLVALIPTVIAIFALLIK